MVGLILHKHAGMDFAFVSLQTPPGLRRARLRFSVYCCCIRLTHNTTISTSTFRRYAHASAVPQEALNVEVIWYCKIYCNRHLTSKIICTLGSNCVCIRLILLVYLNLCFFSAMHESCLTQVLQCACTSTNTLCTSTDGRSTNDLF